MTRNSLRFRLLAAAAFSISVVLFISAFGLMALFEHHVQRRIDAELETFLSQLAGRIEFTRDGRIRFTHHLVDPRFKQPLSGLYWQILDETRPTLLRSRSLWDEVIELPKDRLAPGIVHRHTLPGPGQQTLLVRERQIIFRPETDARRLRIAVAVDKRDLITARNAFAADMLPYLAVMALLLIVLNWTQVRIGLAPLDAIRRGLSAIRSGTRSRLQGTYPDEVMPLAKEMNELLAVQEQAIERSRTWTADLAHGLKTPLSVLSADAQRLREQGNAEIADELDQLVGTMCRRVDRELIRARVRSGVQVREKRTDVGQIVNSIVRALKRTPVGSRIAWTIAAPDRAFASLQPDDLADLLGNLLENATKWAEKTIKVTVSLKDHVIILIEDDGSGVPHDQLEMLCKRGIRLDEQKQGSGLGLAIARDIVEAYRGELSFDHSPMGGLAVRVRLPTSG